MPSRYTNNFPESGRGLGHMTPTIFGIRSNISVKLLAIETSYLIHGFVWAMPSRRTNNFPWKWAWPRSRDPYNFWRYGRLSYRQLGFLLSMCLQQFIVAWCSSSVVTMCVSGISLVFHVISLFCLFLISQKWITTSQNKYLVKLWLNSIETLHFSGFVPPPEIAVPPPKVVSPPPGDAVWSVDSQKNHQNCCHQRSVFNA